MDLVLGPIVLRNRGEFQFEDISRKTTLEMPELATGCTVGDYDLDGRLDIYVSRSSGSVQNTSWIDGPGARGTSLWRNLGDWRFEEVAEKVNATAGNRSVFTAAWLDANDDGRPDIYAIGEFGPGVLLVNQPGWDVQGNAAGAGRRRLRNHGARGGGLQQRRPRGCLHGEYVQQSGAARH